MKKIIACFLIATLIAGVSCRKDDNPKIPELIQVPTPLLTKDASADQIISAQDPNSFNGKFIVDLFFENDVKPQKFDVVAIKNEDKSKIVTIKENVTTFPTTIEITGAELASLFGEPIVLGDKFDITVNVTTQSGQTILGFPATGNPYASGVANQPGASTLIRYEAVCKFESEEYQGDFEVVLDEWEDYAPGDIVQVTRINDTQLSFTYPASNAKPIIVNVNPANNSTSVTKQVYGNYSWGAQYGDFSAASVPSLNNFVAPCDGILSVVLNHTVAAGSFGNFRIVLKKK
jgi:hypothetical protein